VDEAVRKAKEAGVVVHTVGVGTEAGQPVPDFDRDGKAIGFKKDEQGSVVVSRLNTSTLEAIARGTGGRFFRITPADTSLSGLAAAIEGMEQKTLAREYSYRRKERFQVPLAVGLGALAAALLFPLPRLRSVKRSGAVRLAAAWFLALLGTAPTLAQTPSPPTGGAPPTGAAPAPSPAPKAGAPAPKPGVLDEVLLRPRRLSAEGRSSYEHGNHPAALQSFERAATLRPLDPKARYNLADGLYKNGKFPEAATLYRSLGEDGGSPLAGSARYNLGNALFQQKDYKGAIQAYRDALHVAPDDGDTLRNLETALRALKQQEEQQKKDQKDKKPDQDKDKKSQDKQDQKSGQKPDADKKPQESKPPKPETPEEKEQKRFQQDAGMPKDRAMQLLDALQQNEKSEQKKLLAAKRAERKKGKDW
jgi:tetratricopeptide (TPR) repeat protein